MLSDYINSCERIKKAVEGGSGSSQGGSGGSPGGGGTSSSQQSTCTETSAASTTCVTTPASQCNANGGRTSSCQQTPAAPQATSQNCNSVQQQRTQTTAKSNNGCCFKKFCEQATKNASTCKVFGEIKDKCKCECDNICVNSDQICKEFIKETMEQCEKEARDLIIQLNEDISPELLNTIVLRFIGLQLYLRIIQEFSLLRDYFTKIIENLETCYNAIKSCTCGTGNNNCSKDGKCLCTIFYKLFKATVSLHDRYCKIISYMKGESDEDLYKVIPSLSLTRSIILLTSYFNDYIKSDYMVEGSSCGCGYNVYVEPSLFRSIASIAAETVLWLFSTVTESKYTGLKTCPCHKYSSKLDDVVTLLQTGIEDTDDCDGLLSDVIFMISPLVKDKCVDTKTMDNNPSTTHKDSIDQQLNTVNQQKSTLSTVITGINGNSKCDGTAGSSGVGGSPSSGAGCTSCDSPSSESQTATNCNGDGTIATACGQYINNGGTTGCGGDSKCECGCKACTSGSPGECCCFCKHQSCPCEECDTKSKTCLANLVKSLSYKGIKCNGGDNGKDCLMCYLCVLKHSIEKLQSVYNGTGSNGCILDETLQNLPNHIKTVVGKICGSGTENSAKECCEKCNGNGCSENGTCSCNGGECCKVNDRFSNFTKFLLGTNSCSTSTSNKCKTIAKTLTDLNNTLNTFIGENGTSDTSSGTQCNCNNGGDNCCTNKCCCGKPDCSKDNGNGCNSTQPIKILSCVINCGLKGIKERSEKIETHINKIEKCLTCICEKMKKLEEYYCNLHKCISDLGKCVKDETKCLEDKICNLAKAKENNLKTFKDVIDKSRDVLSDICGYIGFIL